METIGKLQEGFWALALPCLREGQGWFRVLGFRVLGFRYFGFRVWGVGFWVLGFRV